MFQQVARSRTRGLTPRPRVSAGRSLSHPRSHSATPSPHYHQMPTYCVEYAKSNRSTCKACGSKIAKDAVRIGTTQPGPGDYDITSWRHLACTKKPASLSSLPGAATLAAHDRSLVQAWLDGDSATVNARKRQEDMAAARAAAASSPPRKKPRADSGGQTPPTSKMPMPGSAKSMPLEEELAKRDDFAQLFGRLPIPALKNCLRANEQLLGGSKP